MLQNLTHFFHPSSVEEACALLNDTAQRNVALAGGTWLAGCKDGSIEGLVDLRSLNLSYLRQEATEIIIGAMTPVQTIFKADSLSGPSAELLQTAAGRIGSTLLRNSITIGGNVVSVFPWSDLPPVLLVLDASLTCRKGRPKRTFPVETLYVEGVRAALHKNEIVTEFRIPAFTAKGTGTAFQKFAKTANDYALTSVAARLTLKGAVIEEARIALNGVVKRPQRLPAAEALLTGQKPTDDLLAQAAKRAIVGLEPTADFRATAEYRLEITEVLVRRALEEALTKARGK